MPNVAAVSDVSRRTASSSESAPRSRTQYVRRYVGCARVHGLPDVGSGVGEAHHDLGLGEHRADRVDALVEQGPREHDAPIRLERQIDERLDRADAAASATASSASLRAAVVAGEPVRTVEHVEDVEAVAIAGRLFDELGAPRRVAEHGNPLVEREGAEGPPGRVAIERSAVRETGQDADEPRRRLRAQLCAAGVGGAHAARWRAASGRPGPTCARG